MAVLAGTHVPGLSSISLALLAHDLVRNLHVDALSLVQVLQRAHDALAHVLCLVGGFPLVYDGVLLHLALQVPLAVLVVHVSFLPIGKNVIRGGKGLEL